LQLVVVYRGVFLYGGSGSGKSSLINAGLLPAVEEEGFRADRIRVQPRFGDEFVVERMPMTEDDGSFLPSSFASDAGNSAQLVFGAHELRSRLAALGTEVRAHRPLLILDQFEELVTLFEEAPDGRALEEALACQQRIVDVLIDLLQDTTLPVKLLFGFREDYLAKVRKLLDRSPELVSQSLSLTPPGSEALPRLIRGPFEDHPGQFDHELSPELATQLAEAVRRHTGAGSINLTELQIVCLRLWESSDPERLLEEKGIQGLLEEYLEESLNRFPEELHYPAVALLSQMVTASGARNVVSGDDLIERVRTDEGDIPEERLERTLDALEKETKLVRRERRGDLDLFEISSEFLVPWIGRQRAERLKAREQAKLAQELEERRRRQRARLIQRLGLVISGLFVAAAVLAGLTFVWWRTASSERDESRSREAAQSAFVLLDSQDDPRFQVDPDESVREASRAYDFKKTIEAEEALRAALVRSRRRAVLRGHTDAVVSSQFSPDGTLVVTGGVDGTVRFWNSATGTAVGHRMRLPGSAAVTAASFNRDGTLVLVTSDDGIARVFRRSTGKELAVLGPPQGGTLTAAFGPKGNLIVTGHNDGTVRVWRLSTGMPIALLRGHEGPVSSATFSPDGELVLTASEDGSARVWRWSASKEIKVLKAGDGRIFSAAFSPEGGELVVTASDDQTARVWAWRKGTLLTRLRAPGPILSASFSPDDRFVVTAASSESGQLQVWEVYNNERAITGRPLVTLRGHKGPCYDAAFSPDGKLVASACAEGGSRLWDPATGKTEDDFVPTRSAVTAAISQDGTRLVTGDKQGTVQVWSVPGLDRGASVEARQAVESVAFSPDREHVAVATENGAVIWRATGTRPTVLKGHLGPVLSVAFSPDGKLVITAGSDQTARIWDTATGREVGQPLQSFTSVNSASFSPDGKAVLTASEDGTARVWDAKTGRELYILGTTVTGPATTAAFSPDGKLIAVAKFDKTATIWNVEDPDKPKVLTLLRGHNGPLTSISFSTDGKFVVTASEDATARVWEETHSGRALNVLRGHNGPVNSAVFSPRDSTVVLTAGDDGFVRRYRCDACLKIDALEKLGNWSDEELKGEAP
jgi:WD40 repeat protein